MLGKNQSQREEEDHKSNEHVLQEDAKAKRSSDYMMVDSPEYIQRGKCKHCIKLHLSVAHKVASGIHEHTRCQQNKYIVKQMCVPDLAMYMSKEMFHMIMGLEPTHNILPRPKKNIARSIATRNITCAMCLPRCTKCSVSLR